MQTIDSAFPDFESSVLQNKTWCDLLLAPLCGLLAFLIYWLLTPSCLPPGAPAELTATVMGLPAQTPPFHGLWRCLAALLAHLPLGTVSYKLTLLSAICSALATSLVYLVSVELMMHRLIPHGTSIDRLKVRAVQIGGVVGALAFAVASPVALAATRASLRSLDVLTLLVPIWLFLRYYKGGSVVNLLLAGAACGLGMGENPGCAGVFFALVFCGIVLFWRQDRSTLPMLAFAGVALVLMLLVYPGLCYLQHLPGGDVTQLLKAHYHEIRMDYRASRTGMLICVLAFLPLLLALATMNQTLNYGEDYESLLTLSTLATASMLVLTHAFPSFRTYALLSPEPPVLPYLFAAMTAGFVAASWWTIALCHTTTGGEPDEPDLYHPGAPNVVRGFGYGLALAITAGMCVAGFVTFKALRGRPDWYPQRCAEMILQELGERHWLFGYTPVNTHLAVLARERHFPLQIVPLAAEDFATDNPWSSRMRLEIEKALQQDTCFAGLDPARLADALAMGPEAFLRTWLLLDPRAPDKLVIAGSPLTWAACGFTPVPALFFFSGSAAMSTPPVAFADQLFQAEQMRQQAESSRLVDGTMVNVLAAAAQALSDSAAYAGAAYRRAGVTNGAAILDAAWASSPLPTSGQRSLLATALAWIWETTVLPGRPERGDILHTIREQALLEALDQKDELAMRRAPAGGGRKVHAVRDFSELYARARTSADLATVNRTFAWLAQLEQGGAPASQLLVMRAEANLALAGGVTQADALLREVIGSFPRDLWARHLLVAASLQRGDVDRAEQELLPAMEKAAGNRANDLLRLTRALVLCARGKTSLRMARDLFVEVADANPDLLVAREWALRLDLLLNDASAITRDAGILVACEPNHAQANEVLAGLAVRSHQWVEADRLYRQSLTGAMTPQAMVGWARLYCLERKYAEALQLARKATAEYPVYLDGWLVLGDALEATGKPGEAAVVRSHATVPVP